MKWNRPLFILWFAALGTSAGMYPAVGAPIIYFDRDNQTGMPPMSSFPNSLAKFNQFTSALGAYGIETVENIDTVNPPFGFDPLLTFAPTTINATTLQTTTAAAAPFPGFSIGAKMLVENDALSLFNPQAPPLPAADTVFRFNQLITAFGLHLIQAGDEGVPPDPNHNNNPVIVRLTNTMAGTSVFVPIQLGPGWGFNNVAFLGVTDTVPFNQVTIIETTDLTDGMTYDNLVAGFVIPEPGSCVLLVFACIFCGRRGVSRLTAPRGVPPRQR